MVQLGIGVVESGSHVPTTSLGPVKGYKRCCACDGATHRALLEAGCLDREATPAISRQRSAPHMLGHGLRSALTRCRRLPCPSAK